MSSTPAPAPASQQNLHSSRAARVLVDHVVDGERVELAGREAIDGVGDVLEQLGEARLVVRSDQRAIGLTLALRSHPDSGPRCRRLARARAGTAARRPAGPELALPPGACRAGDAQRRGRSGGKRHANEGARLRASRPGAPAVARGREGVVAGECGDARRLGYRVAGEHEHAVGL